MTDLDDALFFSIIYIIFFPFRALWQHTVFEAHIKELPIPLGKVIMVLDFAENFACFGQNEVQAAYWQREQVIIV